MKYKQGLMPDFVDALNALHDTQEGIWWSKMLDDPELFVAIRNNYLNVYFRGCSLAKISLHGKDVVAETHYKYLLKPTIPKPYVRAVAGQFQLADHWPKGLADPFIRGLSDLKALKSAAKTYAGEEKKFVGKVIQSHTNVVDVEMALTKEAEEATDAQPGEGASAKRIDIVALRWDGAIPTLDFYEAKLFGNKEIRAAGDAKVISQIHEYEKLLRKYESDIRDGFLWSCQNLIDLNGIPAARKACSRAVLSSRVVPIINFRPNLIIGGFDKDQRDGPIWLKHKSKLTDALVGPERLMLSGSAKSTNLRRGIAPSSESSN